MQRECLSFSIEFFVWVILLTSNIVLVRFKFTKLFYPGSWEGVKKLVGFDIYFSLPHVKKPYIKIINKK